MADIKHKGNKWIVISDEGREMGSYDTKEEAVKRLRSAEGHKEHGTGKSKKDKSYHAKKHSELLTILIATADELDKNGFYVEAEKIDGIIKKITG